MSGIPTHTHVCVRASFSMCMYIYSFQFSLARQKPASHAESIRRLDNRSILCAFIGTYKSRKNSHGCARASVVRECEPRLAGAVTPGNRMRYHAFATRERYVLRSGVRVARVACLRRFFPARAHRADKTSARCNRGRNEGAERFFPLESLSAFTRTTYLARQAVFDRSLPDACIAARRPIARKPSDYLILWLHKTQILARTNGMAMLRGSGGIKTGIKNTGFVPIFFSVLYNNLNKGNRLSTSIRNDV